MNWLRGVGKLSQLAPEQVALELLRPLFTR
jgi:hypothetical protein